MTENKLTAMARAHWETQLAMGDLLYDDQSPAVRQHLESRMRAAVAVLRDLNEAQQRAVSPEREADWWAFKKDWKAAIDAVEGE